MLSLETLLSLDELYSKADLEKGLFTLAKTFYLNNTQSFEGVETDKINHILHHKTNPTNTEVLLIAFSVFSNAVIYKAFVNSLPSWLAKSIELLMWLEKLSDSELQSRIGSPVLEQRIVTYRYSPPTVLPPFLLFKIEASMVGNSINGTSYDLFLSIHPAIKDLLVAFYDRPKHFNLVPIAVTPTNPPYQIFAVSQFMELELPDLVAYRLADHIKYASNGRPLDSAIGRMQKANALDEFFNDADEWYAKIRTKMMAGLLANVYNTQPDGADLLKTFFTKAYTQMVTAPIIWSYLKGWNQNEPTADKKEKAEVAMLSLVRQIPVNEWISLENLLGYIDFKQIKFVPMAEYWLFNKLYVEIPSRAKKPTRKYWMPVTNEQLLAVPFVKGSFFLFAAFGLVDIAFRMPHGNELIAKELSETTPYDGLAYVKLTQLGAYVLGINDSYEPLDYTQEGTITLDSDSLLLIAKGNFAFFDRLLAKFSTKLGLSRYKVTPGHFLADCNTAEDVKVKINLFKRIVQQPLPSVWEAFFASLISQSTIFKQDTQWMVFKLPTDNPTLQHLIARDPVLKNMILKAEQYHVMVSKFDLPQFKNRLKELGYLVSG